jgi:hypothetical protein
MFRERVDRRRVGLAGMLFACVMCRHSQDSLCVFCMYIDSRIPDPGSYGTERISFGHTGITTRFSERWKARTACRHTGAQSRGFE